MFRLQDSPAKLVILPYFTGEEPKAQRSEEADQRPHSLIGSCEPGTQTPVQQVSTLITQ